MLAGFEPARAKPSRLAVYLLNHSDTTSAMLTGFEPARAKPSRFQIYLLNHSDTTSYKYKK